MARQRNILDNDDREWNTQEGRDGVVTRFLGALAVISLAKGKVQKGNIWIGNGREVRLYRKGGSECSETCVGSGTVVVKGGLLPNASGR